MAIIRDMGEASSTWMKFTIDGEDDHKDRRVPMLDICCWRTGPKTIIHGFYEKPMTSNLVILAKSATPQNGKMATLSQEIIRRMRNTSRRAPLEERIKYLNKFML